MPFKMNKKLLFKKLFAWKGLSAEERTYLTDKTITITEVSDFIEEELKTNNYFPKEAFKWSEGKSVYEGCFIEKIENNKYKVHWQRHHPLNPYGLAEKNEINCKSLKFAIDVYLQSEHRYEIGGFKIIK